MVRTSNYIKSKIFKLKVLWSKWSSRGRKADFPAFFTKIQYPKILEGKDFISIFVQGSIKGDPELSAAKVPTPMEFAKTPEDRDALELFLARYAFATPYMVPAGVPSDRVAALRRAFAAAMHDSDLVEEARRTMADIKSIEGEELQQRVQTIY